MFIILWEFRFVIVCIIAAVLFALFEWERTKEILYALMLQAKRLAKDAVLKSGQQQEDWVLERAYAYLPGWITMFISKEVMRKIIKWLYNQAKDYLDDGKLNNSIGNQLGG